MIIIISHKRAGLPLSRDPDDREGMLAVIGMKEFKHWILFPVSFCLFKCTWVSDQTIELKHFLIFLFEPVFRGFMKNLLERGSVFNKSNTKANLYEIEVLK